MAGLGGDRGGGIREREGAEGLWVWLVLHMM